MKQERGTHPVWRSHPGRRPECGSTPERPSGTIEDINDERRGVGESADVQRRLQSILDSMFAFVGLFSPDGVLLDANRAPLEAAGVRKEDVVGKPFEEIVYFSHSPEMAEFVRALIARAAAGETVRTDISIHVGAGRVIDMDAVFGPIRGPEGGVSLVVGSGVDVTERKRAEALLRESEERFRQIAENVGSVFWMMNADQTEVLYVSPSFERVWGRPISDVMSEPRAWLEMVHPADRERVTRCWNANPHNYQIENRIVRPNGEVRWVRVRLSPVCDFEGRRVRVVGIAEDITESVATEARLRLQDEALRNSLVAIALATPDGTLTSVNPAFLALWGYADASDVVGRRVIDLWRGQEAAQQMFERTIRNGSWSGELSARRSNGAAIDVSVAGSVIRGGDGQIVGIIGSFIDVSERTRAERERERAMEELRRSLAEKDVLLKELHHRVKNNLQVVASLLFLQSRRIPDPATRRALLESRDRIASMALVHETIYSTGTFGSVDAGSYLASVIRGIESSWGPARRGEIRLRVEWSALDVEVAMPCGLIVGELLTNALKYAYPDPLPVGEIRVSLVPVSEGQLCLSVADDGVGFRTGDRIDAPTSLGLSLVCALAEQIDGRIESLPPPGTEVRLTFPAGGEERHP